MEVAVMRLTIRTFSNSYSFWSDGNGGAREGLDRERRWSAKYKPFGSLHQVATTRDSHCWAQSFQIFFRRWIKNKQVSKCSRSAIAISQWEHYFWWRIRFTHGHGQFASSPRQDFRSFYNLIKKNGENILYGNYENFKMKPSSSSSLVPFYNKCAHPAKVMK